jgi:hypothetical protein
LTGSEKRNTAPRGVFGAAERWPPCASIIVYGLCNVLGTGVKAASHPSGGDLSSAEQARAEGSLAEAEYLQGLLLRYVPAAAGALVNTSVCICTSRPDRHFVVGLRPQSQQVFASP